MGMNDEFDISAMRREFVGIESWSTTGENAYQKNSKFLHMWNFPISSTLLHKNLWARCHLTFLQAEPQHTVNKIMCSWQIILCMYSSVTLHGLYFRSCRVAGTIFLGSLSPPCCVWQQLTPQAPRQPGAEFGLAWCSLAHICCASAQSLHAGTCKGRKIEWQQNKHFKKHPIMPSIVIFCNAMLVQCCFLKDAMGCHWVWWTIFGPHYRVYNSNTIILKFKGLFEGFQSLIEDRIWLQDTISSMQPQESFVGYPSISVKWASCMFVIAWPVRGP